MTKIAFVVSFAIVAMPAVAQQPAQPSVPPEYVIQACYAMARGEFDNALGSAANSNWNAAKAGQFAKEAAESDAKVRDLQKKLAEAEAKLAELQK
jgi:hypothetical protein